MAKVDLFPDFKELFESLNSANVEYLLIGGYSVVYYGYKRATDDLDIWIAVSAENAEKVSHVLRSWGGFSKAKVLPELFAEPDRVYIFGREPNRVDILTSASGVVFSECYRRKVIVDMDGVRVPVISLDDLRANKIASGRAKDLADVEFLAGIANGRMPKRKKVVSRKPKREK